MLFLPDSSTISNNASFRLKHLGVPDGSDGSDGTSYPLTENYTLPVALHTYLHYFAPGIRTIRMTRVLHSSQGCSYAVAGYATPGDVYVFHWPIATLNLSAISDATLAPYMFSFEILSHIAIQSSLGIHRLPLHLLRHYRISHV